MEGEPADSLLDLSHLTEEEQSKILQVLQRDLDLRLLDEGRVRSEVTANSLNVPVVYANQILCDNKHLISDHERHVTIRRHHAWGCFDQFWTMCRVLKEKETDQRLLRSMSGAWFMEERNKRQHTWSGSALVHATIRHKRTKSRGLCVCLLAGTRVSH